MITADLKVEKYTILIETGDEMVKFVEGLDKINRDNDAEGFPMVFTAEKEEINDQLVGKFSRLVVSKFGLDSSDPRKAIRIAEYIPVDADGNVVRESHQLVRHASIVLQAKGIQRFQEKRGLKLKAAQMNEIKFNFQLDDIGNAHEVAGIETNTADANVEKV